jgi:hypothetical protein
VFLIGGADGGAVLRTRDASKDLNRTPLLSLTFLIFLTEADKFAGADRSYIRRFRDNLLINNFETFKLANFLH